MKIDPHNHKQRYLGWKERTKSGIPGISSANSRTISQFMHDMELGLNVSTKSRKGARSFIRLNTLRDKLRFFSVQFKVRFGIDDITAISEEQLHAFFSDMRAGRLLKHDGKQYQSTSYFVTTFKAFWHWHMVVQRKNGMTIPDITAYLDSRPQKTQWVYLNEEQVRQLCNNASLKYKVLMLFLYDSGIRSPTELVNVRVSDLSADFKQLTIREETSKTFGRRINLMLCPDILKEYAGVNGLQSTDYLFKISPPVVNRYLKRLATRVLGDKQSLAGQPFSSLTMYDFRHSSACYWLPRYKSESALKYRFGWKKSEMIHYYTELLGMRDTISEDDMFVDVTKTEIEQRLAQTEKEKRLMQEQIDSLQKQIDEILLATKRLAGVLS